LPSSILHHAHIDDQGTYNDQDPGKNDVKGCGGDYPKAFKEEEYAEEDDQYARNNCIDVHEDKGSHPFIYMDRYARQSALVNQERLKGSKVLIAGVGGLGNFVATELALAGVGDIVLVDPDVVEIHNLNRQFIFTEEDVGKPKAEVAAERLSKMNPEVTIHGIVGKWQDLDVNEYDLVFDCLDTWAEKRALMDTRKGIIISGSVGEDVGYVAVLNRKQIMKEKIRGTRTARVLGARVGIVGSIMANEGIRELNGEVSPLRDKMLYMDFRRMVFHAFDL